MRIVITDPSLSETRAGNFSTVKRWAKILRELGSRVDIHKVRQQKREPLPTGDLLIALHASHSHQAIRQWKRRDPDAPIVLALSGTDLHQQLPAGRAASRKVIGSLRASDRWIAFHRQAARHLPSGLLSRMSTGVDFIPQSASPLPSGRKPIRSKFRILVIGYLRSVKDPLLPVEALKHLPCETENGRPIEIVHLGGALSEGWQRRAERTAKQEPRWRWLGAVNRAKIRSYLASSHLLVHPSLEEGGANVIGEALMARIPILASDAPGNLGLLGDNYPGIFRRRDAKQLATLIQRWIDDRAFQKQLQKDSRLLRRGHTATAEKAAWRRLLAELSGK